jgi:hypothetical protein
VSWTSLRCGQAYRSRLRCRRRSYRSLQVGKINGPRNARKSTEEIDDGQNTGRSSSAKKPKPLPESPAPILDENHAWLDSIVYGRFLVGGEQVSHLSFVTGELVETAVLATVGKQRRPVPKSAIESRMNDGRSWIGTDINRPDVVKLRKSNTSDCMGPVCFGVIRTDVCTSRSKGQVPRILSIPRAAFA